MLPKFEKNKKNNNEDQDLELEQPGLFDKENEKERIAKKRKFVYIAMFLTVGLSLFFWAYRTIKNFNFSFNLKLPSLNFSLPTPKATKFTPPENTTVWGIFFKKTNSDLIIYQNNQDSIFTNQNLESILDKIDKTNFIISSSYTTSLPQGFKFKELIEENNNTFSYFSKIFTPSQELFLAIKINDSKNLAESKKLIPNLIDQLYWYSLQK